jgi:peptide/nickel transport system substrate-binding protein
MSQGNGGVWTAIQTLLLAGVLLACVTVTCSNSRLEERVIRLEKRLESGALATGPATSPAGVRAPDAGPAAAGAAGLPATTGASAAGAPGTGTGTFAVGWGGKRAEILRVEGAAAGAPVTLAQKPLPQNDWYVTRRGAPPRTLNYYVTSEGETTSITAYVLGRLLQPDWDKPERPMPMLATSWEVSDDKLTYTFHLRRGVQFADGRPFTSADLVWSFDVMRDPEVRADNLRGAFEDVASVAAPDPYTFVVKYTRRYWGGIYAFGNGLRVLNKGWYEETIPEYARKLGVAKFATQPGQPGFGEVFNNIRVPCPGTGPYYLASDDDYRKDSLELVQNPFYFGTQVHPRQYNFTRLRWIYISDEVAAFEAFRKGEFDVTVVDADRWEDQLSKDPTIAAVANHYRYDHMGLDCSFISWNCRRPPFDDARVRTAMTHLTDREWLLREIERGRGTVAVCKSKRSYDTYSNELPAHPFDVAKAKELLAAAGWRDTDGDGVLDRDGKRFEFELKVPSGRTFFTRVGGQLQDACRQAGIRMSVRPLEWATFIEDLNKHEFDALMLYNSWSSPWIDLFESYHSSQDKPDGGNTSGWSDPRVDELLQAMREEFDDAKRTRMFHEFNRLYYEAQPETLLVHGMVDVLQNRRFEDVKVRPTGLPLFDFWVKPENVLHR